MSNLMHWFVFSGLLISGAVILLNGYVATETSILGIGIYAGWFFAIYSAISYLLITLLCSIRGDRTNQSNLVAINFGITLLGCTSLKNLSDTGMLDVSVALGVGAMFGVLLTRQKIFSPRYEGIVVISLTALPLTDKIKDYWYVIFIFLGVALILSSVIRALSGNRKQGANQKKG